MKGTNALGEHPAENPYSPTFGVSPPVLAGREAVLTSFHRALEEGVGSPGRATLYLGGRGSGKTVILNRLPRPFGAEPHCGREIAYMAPDGTLVP